MSISKKIYLIAGEPSGDVIGANLINSVKNSPMRTEEGFEFRGIGGESMGRAGCDLVCNYDDIALMGFAEIIPSIFRIIKKIRLVVRDIISYQPDIIITIDSPGFNFRVVRKLRKVGFTKPIVHYVAPTVWAYSPERAETVRKFYDHILVLFAFETKYFRKMPCTFVGHPLIENDVMLPDPKEETNTEGSSIRNITVMPGSRVGEIKRHMPAILQTITNMQDRIAFTSADSTNVNGNLINHYGHNLHWYFLCHPNTSTMVHKLVQNYAVAHNDKIDISKIFIITDKDLKTKIMANSILGLIKAGTAVLEAALMGLPMVTFYKINPLSAWFLKRKLKVPYFTLCNILLNRSLIPELIQDGCTADNMVRLLEGLLTDEKARKAQLDGFKNIILRTNEMEEHEREKVMSISNKDSNKEKSMMPAKKPSEIASDVILHIMNSPNHLDAQRPRDRG